MEIKEFQEKTEEVINNIDKKLGCEHNPNNSFFHLSEEFGELARELNKPNIRGEEINKKGLGNEIADVLFFISRIATLNNLNLEKVIDNKINELRERHSLEI